MNTSRSHRVPVAALSPRGFKWGCSPSGVFCYLGGRKGTSQGSLRQGSLASSRRQEWRGVWSRHVMVPEAGGLWTSGFPVRTVCVLICSQVCFGGSVGHIGICGALYRKRWMAGIRA